MGDKTVVVQLCRSNSIGDRYQEPTVTQWLRVTEEEAEKRLQEQLPNGFFWRREPADRTGN